MKKVITLLLTFSLLATLLAGCGGKTSTSTPGPTSSDNSDNTKTYQWNVASTFGGTAMRNIEAMLAEVTKRTNGRMQFNLYPSNSLISIPEVPDALKNGIADIAVVATVNYPSILTYNAEVVGMPFIGVQSGDQAIEAWYALKEAFPNEIQAEWDSIGAFPWFMYATAGYHLFTIKENDVIRTPKDLAGHKIMAGKTQILELINKYGGAGIQAAPTVYYENLEKGVADGVVNAYSVCRTFGALELLRSGTEFSKAGAFYDLFFIAISKKSWEKLDPEVQQAFLDVNANMRADKLEMARTAEDNTNAQKEVSPDYKAYVLTDEEVAAWEEAIVPFNEKAIEEMKTSYKKDKVHEMYEFLLDWLAKKNG